MLTSRSSSCIAEARATSLASSFDYQEERGVHAGEAKIFNQRAGWVVNVHNRLDLHEDRNFEKV